MSKICSSCGHENREEATFCGNCGRRLTAQNMASNLTGGNSSSNDNPKPTYGGNATGDNSAAICCLVFIVLFILLLIMSKG